MFPGSCTLELELPMKLKNTGLKTIVNRQEEGKQEDFYQDSHGRVLHQQWGKGSTTFPWRIIKWKKPCSEAPLHPV